MNDSKFLKDEQDYLDRYDMHTVMECLKLYWDFRKSMEAKRGQAKDMTKKKFDEDVHKATSYAVNAYKIERYRHRAESIRGWMDKDRKLQEKYDLAIPPRNILCKECKSPTKVISKDLYDTLDENSQMLYMYE